MMEQYYLAAADLGEFLYDVGGEAEIAASGTGAPNAPLTEVVGNVISAALSVLGALLLIYGVYGGILWMTSQGNEEKVKKARGLITNAIIGLVITLAAYAIAFFVVGEATTATGF